MSGDWEVDFVSPSMRATHDSPRPAYLLRAHFVLEELGLCMPDIARARVYATAHGLYELDLNGEPIGDDRLAPGWTSYRHRLRYQTYDVTTQLQEGGNVIGAWLGDGWYRGHIGFDGGVWDNYGTDVSLLLQLEITTTDGRNLVVPLSGKWEWQLSPILAAGLYEGEAYDATLYDDQWCRSRNAQGWTPAVTIPLDSFNARIEAPTAPPVREIETIAPVTIEEIPGGRIRLDFGQNISGRLRIRPQGSVGDVIRLHHAEVIEEGHLGTRPLRAATSIDTYRCAGVPGEEWSPRFTIHGFRYAELEGWPGGPQTVDVEAVVLHTDMPRTGWFESSHDGLNQLHSNVVWSMRDNFVDLPTDCPQRDERMGWTGDIQVFASTALYLYGAHGTLTGWLRDLAAEQWDDGHVPNFVPWVECGFPNFPTAAWGDAAVIVPWEMYLHDGDTRVLTEQYDSMRGWVDLVDRLTGHSGLWNSGFQLGDWLDPAAPPESPGDSQTDRYLVATAYHVKTARILARTARLLNKVTDANRYQHIADRAAAAFRAEFITPTGRVVSDTAASLAIALVFDLFDDADTAARAGRRLLELVEHSGYRITTGFVGTPIICDALVLAGDPDAAYRLLLQDRLPSWLYPVSMGATTIWERWDSMLPDGSINPGDMTSFNHYALGAVADFLHRSVAGLASAAPGWKKIRFQPHPGGGLTYTHARHESPQGTTSISWQREGTAFTLQLDVPPGAEGIVILPGADEQIRVAPGHHTFHSTFRDPADDPLQPPATQRRQRENA
ncbi:family 78 glycoside hydrolase catalytic domain [Micromonospora sp. DT81.3]|uniref:family 78 glycoside hydrolase catalytic domain n=1 Tax=Micromonospora sp. DT81.3 TaxID=3416523 RepID=UPI003CF35129